tara:strand:- start:1165 stop:1848 length:684 start_codon:yes stop_codon:yes gene_type:complete
MSLIIENINKSYEKKKVLSNLTFSCERGEIIGLLGLNGAGKTTLIKILTGINLNWKGKISFNGIDFRKNIRIIQRITGYLPENNQLYNDFYVYEYFNFISSLYKLKNKNISDIISIAGLDNFYNSKISSLSKGYKQRIGLAAAIIHDPEILILDEPMTGLDPNQIIETRNFLKKISKNKIIILSTHILQEVKALCNRFIILNQGKIYFDSSIQKNKVNSIERIFKNL